MKKILSLFVLICMFVNIQAQGLKLGIKAGGNFTTNTSVSFKENYQGGFQAGVFARVKANDFIGIQVEGLVSNITLKISPTATGFRTALTDLKATYLHIPILLNVSPIPLLSLQVGPQIGMTVAQTANALQNGNTRLLNTIAQEYAKQTGQAAPTNFEGMKSIVGAEVAKAISQLFPVSSELKNEV